MNSLEIVTEREVGSTHGKLRFQAAEWHNRKKYIYGIFFFGIFQNQNSTAFLQFLPVYDAEDSICKGVADWRYDVVDSEHIVWV